MNYIATREGVDRMDDAWKAKKATAKQKKLIDALVKKHPEIAQTEEYRKYSSVPCRGNASVLVDGLLDEVPEFFDDNRTYLEYMATRPRAERLGMHGLFSDDGQTLDLAEDCETGGRGEHGLQLRGKMAGISQDAEARDRKAV